MDQLSAFHWNFLKIGIIVVSVIVKNKENKEHSRNSHRARIKLICARERIYLEKK